MGACACKDKPAVPSEDVQAVDGSQKSQGAGPKVVIVGARGLREAEGFPGSERFCYCKMGVAGNDDDQIRTGQVKNALDPTWNHSVEVMGFPQEGGSLDFNIWDADADGKGEELLGKCTLEGSQFQENGFNGEIELQEAGQNVVAFLRVKISVAGRPFPPGPEREFAVSLEKPKRKSPGIDVELQDGKTLYVSAVKSGGPVQLYNKEAEPARQVQAGDFIVKVNDAEGDSKKLNEAMKKETTVTMVVRRAEVWRVAVEKPDSKAHVGLEFVKPPVGTTVLLTKVNDGPVATWNQENPEHEVKAGDRIIAINGKHAKPADMLKQMKAQVQFTMTVARPADVEGPGEPEKSGEEPREGEQE